MKKQWCIAEVGAEFVWRMEDVLDLYEEPYDPNKPAVCFDEMPYQMVAETAYPCAHQGRASGALGHEYERRGTADIFAFF